MNLALIPTFYAVISAATLWLGLLWCARAKPGQGTRAARLLCAAVTTLLLFVPLGGLPLWKRAFSFYPNPSLPMLGVICAALWERLFGLAVFKPAEWRAIWLFGAVLGSVLYLHSIFAGSVDYYYWGWERTGAIWGLAGLAIVLLLCGSRFGVLLLVALIAYAVNALESKNCWDYVIDPIYWLISLGAIGRRLVMALFGPRGSVSKAPLPPPVPIPVQTLPAVAISSHAPAGVTRSAERPASTRTSRA